MISVCLRSMYEMFDIIRIFEQMARFEWGKEKDEQFVGKTERIAHNCIFVMSDLLICSFGLSDLSVSFTFAHVSWAIRLKSLNCPERPEGIAHISSFILSQSLTVAHLIWAIWANERIPSPDFHSWMNSNSKVHKMWFSRAAPVGEQCFFKGTPFVKCLVKISQHYYCIIGHKLHKENSGLNGRFKKLRFKKGGFWITTETSWPETIFIFLKSNLFLWACHCV